MPKTRSLISVEQQTEGCLLNEGFVSVFPPSAARSLIGALKFRRKYKIKRVIIRQFPFYKFQPDFCPYVIVSLIAFPTIRGFSLLSTRVACVCRQKDHQYKKNSCYNEQRYIVYVIESAAYGVIFTSCLCENPNERGTSE